MKSNYTAITHQDGEWWVRWIEEIPGVNAQENTKEELMTSLREILKEALEFNREEARASEGGNHSWWRNRATNRHSVALSLSSGCSILLRQGYGRTSGGVETQASH